jgi:hypothetical protein
MKCFLVIAMCMPYKVQNIAQRSMQELWAAEVSVTSSPEVCIVSLSYHVGR